MRRPRHAGPPVTATSAGELWPVDAGAGLDYSGTVWFRRIVDWEGTRPRGSAVLDLDMVDYYAEGVREQRLRSVATKATSSTGRPTSPGAALRPGRNVIAVKVSAPALAFDMSQQYAVSWPKMQNQIKGIFAYHDTRPGATSARGQERSTGGVLRGVLLRESTGPTCAGARRHTPRRERRERPPRRRRDVTQLDRRAGRRHAGGLRHNRQLRGPPCAPVRLEARRSQASPRAGRGPRPQSSTSGGPWDYGAAKNLYQLKAHLARDGAGDADRQHPLPITLRLPPGRRQLESSISTESGSTRAARTTSRRSGSPRPTATSARDLRLVVDAQLNSVRVPAHLERPEFYDLADELRGDGLADFPLQWGYTDLPAFHAGAPRPGTWSISTGTIPPSSCGPCTTRPPTP